MLLVIVGKTSHQAISHRVKSITMSNWTNEEVDALTTEFSGGNEAALHIWLQNAPGFGQKYRGGSRPKEGDRIDIFKKFVSDCYDVGMFKATTPFVPTSHTTPKHTAAGVGKAASAAGAPASPALKISKPAAESSLFDDFNSGSAASSPKPAGRDPFGSGFCSTTDLLAQAAHVAPPVSTGPTSSNTGLLFDAFDDTPPSTSPFPTAGFAAPASAGVDTAAPAASSFDFMTPSTDPFSNFTSSANSTSNTNKGSAGFSSFNSFNSDVAVAPSTSGFDFMAADPFANSSSIASSNNASHNDLFSFSNSMSPSPVHPSAASSAAHAPVDDPFGSVFLQPVSSSAAGSGVPSPYGNPSVGIGMAAGRMSGGMGSSMSGGLSGGMNGMGNRSGGNLSPTSHSMNSPAMGMGMGMNTGMGGGIGNNNMRAAGMGMSSMGGGSMSGGMSGPMSGPMGGGMNTGMAFRPAPSAGRGVDAIGDAFGNLNMNLGRAGNQGGAPVAAQQGPASFDFLQGTMKQQLSSLPAGSGSGSGGMNAGRGMTPMGAMGAMGARPSVGQGMNMGMGAGNQQQGYPSAYPPYPPQPR